MILSNVSFCGQVDRGNKSAFVSDVGDIGIAFSSFVQIMGYSAIRPEMAIR
jgi:hypothetical protein